MTTITIDEQMINRFVTNPTLVQKFPFLRLKVGILSACCRQHATVAPHYEAIRMKLANLTPEQAAVFKGATKTDAMVVYYKDPTGKTAVARL